MTISRIHSFARRVLLALMFTGAVGAHADISLNTTRVIFDGKNKEASLIVRNGSMPVLVQSWLESNAPDDKGELPFAITPALARMQANGQQLLRVLYAGGANAMPSDRESVLWVNVQEIPQKSESENSLQIAIRQRIKLFFRPAGLPGTAAEAPAALRWSLDTADGKKVLKVQNPSAYHVSTTGIDLGSGADKQRVSESVMIAPGDSKTFALKSAAAPTSAVSFTAINDYGGSESYQAQIGSSAPAQASPVAERSQK
ncbi:molecular chaperone [Comamonas testosteroni]|uniref:fimbrial biogenesis chaperone n=1 Tax=Comamonas testosteroni TaxID=285 RepID=UPI001E595D7F|nr:molecular chaperone [Comamonas testosteroni]